MSKKTQNNLLLSRSVPSMTLGQVYRHPIFLKFIIGLPVSLGLVWGLLDYLRSRVSVGVWMAAVIFSIAALMAGMAWFFYVELRKIASVKLIEDNYRAILENAGEGILMSDMTGKLLYANHQLESMWGVEPGGWHGQTVFDYLSDQSAELVREKMTARKTGKTESYEQKFSLKSGRENWYKVSANPILGPDGVPQALVLLLTNIDHVKRLEADSAGRRRGVAEHGSYGPNRHGYR